MNQEMGIFRNTYSLNFPGQYDEQSDPSVPPSFCWGLGVTWAGFASSRERDAESSGRRRGSIFCSQEESSMAMDVPSGPSRKGNKDAVFTEILPKSGILYNDETFEMVLCKPKLLPLKSVTLEKLEKMQKQAQEGLKIQEQETSHPQ